ncbi:MAG: hypothetical protein WDZ63_04430 [Burkholderiales bacterium]
MKKSKVMHMETPGCRSLSIDYVDSDRSIINAGPARTLRIRTDRPDFRYLSASTAGNLCRFASQPEKEHTMSDRDAYIEKVKAKIDQWNADIDKLQAKAKEVDADARIKYDEQIAELKKQRDEAEAKMKEARAASEEAWADLRAGFESAWDSVSNAFSTAMKRFK